LAHTDLRCARATTLASEGIPKDMFQPVYIREW